jgi:hypothetical protein
MKRVTITILVPSLPNLPRSTWNYFVMAVLLLPSLVWIAEDRRVWPWDQAWYGEVSVDLWFWLGKSLRGWAGEMADGIPTKAPGIVWLGQFFVPLRGIFGFTETALLFSILLTQFVMLVVLFQIGQRMAPQSRLIPWAGVLFAAGSQLFVGLSHQFFVEPLQALAVAWCFYIVLRCREWTKARLAVHLVSALVLGALAKADTPLYCLTPFLYCGYVLVRKPWDLNFVAEWRSRSSRALVLVFGLLGILCGLWYLHNLAGILQHIRDATGDLALDYGTRDSVIHKLITWSQLMNPSFLDPYLSWGFVAAILVGGGLTVYRRACSSSRQHLHVQPLALLSMIQIALLLFIFSLNITVEPRFMYGLLPCVVIMFMQICVFLPRIALVALIGLGSAQWVIVNGASLGRVDRLSNQSQWLVPLQTNGSRYEELSRVVHLTSDVGERYNIVGVEYPWLNANSAEFFAAKERLRTGRHNYYTSLGYAEKDLNAAMHRIEEIEIRYVITVSEQYQTMPPNFLNVVSLPVLELVRRDPRFTERPFPSDDGVVIFQFGTGSRVAPMRPATSSDTVKPTEPPSVPPKISHAKAEIRGKSAL